MRFIVDTNILVSAIIRDRTPEKFILWIFENGHKLVVNDAIIQEYEGVLMRKKFGLSDDLVRNWIEVLTINSEICPIQSSSYQIRDAKDKIFLDCLYNSNADYLITGDKDFEMLDPVFNGRVLSISDCVNKFLM